MQPDLSRFYAYYLGRRASFRGLLVFVWAFFSVAIQYWVAKHEEDDPERTIGEAYLHYTKSGADVSTEALKHKRRMCS